MIPFIWGTQNNQNHRDKVELWLPGAGVGWVWELLLMGTEFQFCKMKGVLEMDCGDGGITL